MPPRLSRNTEGGAPPPPGNLPPPPPSHPSSNSNSNNNTANLHHFHVHNAPVYNPSERGGGGGGGVYQQHSHHHHQHQHQQGMMPPPMQPQQQQQPGGWTSPPGPGLGPGYNNNGNPNMYGGPPPHQQQPQGLNHHNNANNNMYGGDPNMDPYMNPQLTPYPQQPQQGGGAPMHQQQPPRRVRTPGPPQQQQQQYYPSGGGGGGGTYRAPNSPPHMEPSPSFQSQQPYDVPSGPPPPGALYGGGNPPQQQQPPPPQQRGGGPRGSAPSYSRGGGHMPRFPQQQQPPPPPQPNMYPPPPPQQQQPQQPPPPPQHWQEPQQQNVYMPPMNPPMPMRGRGGLGAPPVQVQVQGQPMPAMAPPMHPQLPPVMMTDDMPEDAQPETSVNFYHFLTEHMGEALLLKEAPLQSLFPPDATDGKPIIVAMDGDYIINHLRSQVQEYDPLWFLHSALPDRLLELVNEHVTLMREKNMEPIWVFNGIGVSGDVEAFLPSTSEVAARDEVWRKLQLGELPEREEIVEAFDTSSSIGEDVIMTIQRFLMTQLNVLAVTAPFLNWCQICTFHAEGRAHMMVGPPEMLLVPYEPMKLVVEINLKTDTVAYFDRDEVLRAMFPHHVQVDGSTTAAGDRLLDFGLLCASHSAITAARASVSVGYQEIFEELRSNPPAYQNISNFISCHEVSSTDQKRTGAQVIKHMKGRSYITYSPVISERLPGSTVGYFKHVIDASLASNTIPRKLTGVFGNLVPMSLFYMQYTGLFSVTLMTIATQSYFRDEFPVSDSVDYHELLHRLVVLRGQTLLQVVLKLREDSQQRLSKISWVRWFGTILVSVGRPKETITLDDWHLDDVESLRDIPDDDLESIRIDHALDINPNMHCIPTYRGEGDGEMSDRRPLIRYRGKKQTLLAIVLKAFDFLGYFSHSAPDGSMDNNTHNNNNDSMDGMIPMNGAAGVLMDESGVIVMRSDDNQNHYNNNNLVYNNMNINNNMNGGGGDTNGSHENLFFTVHLSRSLKNCPPDFHNAIMRFTELVRLDILHVKKNRYVSSDPTQIDAEEESTNDPPEVLLASRIACLISIPYLTPIDENAEFKWAPVYSRHLCAFSVMVRAVNLHLRELMEVIAASIFLTNLSDCPLSDFSAFTSMLPFGDAPSSIGGLLLHYVLVFPSDYENNCQTPEERCDHLNSLFPGIERITESLQRVMTFTFEALFLLNAYCQKDPNCVGAQHLLESTVVVDTISLLCDKWRDHLHTPLPIDPHGLWTPDVSV